MGEGTEEVGLVQVGRAGWDVSYIINSDNEKRNLQLEREIEIK